MAERPGQQPGITQGDIGPRYVRKRLQDEVYLAHYCKAGDRLRIVATLATGVIAALTTVTLTYGGRVQGMDGELMSLGDSVTFSVADGAQTAITARMPEGYVVDLIVSTASAVAVGDMAVVVDLIQGEGSAAFAYGLLAAGWVSPTSPLGLNTPQVTV